MTTRNPVLLIHGIDDTGAVFRKMAVVLEGQGWLTHALDLVPNNGQVGLDRLAEQIQGYVERTFSQDTRFDIVAFSMGGIISRYYLQRLGGLERCDRFITLSSPHHGSLMSYVRQNPGCVQMRPNSQFLQDLNRDFDRLNSVQFTSIWTPNDLMILPAKSSNVPVGKNITVPVLIHPWMLTDDRIIELVGQYLKKTGVG
ncbi:MAG: alpha/beta fold hydrolase [Roseofilum sp. SBFL]|uniref:alpha/beta fold hydrolase n=1 Tax=unclassified Roseofilum TaxID=2620099 RepID=UPI001B18FB13|nr:MULTISPECIES: alpha/beta fold hydrolase [unclassified Roseofilum]MBP0011820.1 alpha/beta fold hydrolase [Roseofilum sp. SID3]MBP0024402.1 alpha/beta fold hydrolase [Roseofilum sp. SID2]MBP0038614.1 alpha/beta fold hydrolase [Roseofilum sp. SID1]MBP0041016.1 alpha/beta fold hydrolase [Roseofilum sp. SBFL]